MDSLTPIQRMKRPQCVAEWMDGFHPLRSRPAIPEKAYFQTHQFNDVMKTRWMVSKDGLVPVPAATILRSSELTDRAYGVFILSSHKKATSSAERPQTSLHPRTGNARPYEPVKPCQSMVIPAP